MFVAKKKDGEFVTLLYQKKEAFREKWKKEKFFCPACNNEVIPKLGEKKRYHFAHVRKECATSSESESLYHLEGKRVLYELLINSGEVSIEHYLKETNQRVDLLWKKGEQTFAIEFQCSNISLSSIQKRTTLYESQNLIPIWIISKNRFRSLKTLTSINSTNWYFLQKNDKIKFPYIISFCPLERKFTYIFPFYPFSPHKTFISMYKSEELILTEPPTVPPLPNWKTQWLHYKRNWRYEYCLYSQQLHLKKYCYAKYGIPLSQIPAIIGIPVKDQYLIETPLIEWQTYIYFRCIHKAPSDFIINLSSVHHHLLKLESNNKIKLRLLPLIKETNTMVPINSYLTILSSLGILEDLGNNNFRKKANPPIPLTIEQAVKEDEKVINRLMLSF